MGLSFSRVERTNDRRADEHVDERVETIHYDKLPPDQARTQRQEDDAVRQEILDSVQTAANNQAHLQGTEMVAMSSVQSGFTSSTAPNNRTTPTRDPNTDNANGLSSVVRGANPETNNCCNKKCLVVGLGLFGVSALAGIVYGIVYAVQHADEMNGVPNPNPGPAPDPVLSQKIKDQLTAWNMLSEDAWWSNARAWVTANPLPSWLMQNQVLLFAHRIADRTATAIAKDTDIDGLKASLISAWNDSRSLDALYLAARNLKLNGTELRRYEKINVLVQAVSAILTTLPNVPSQVGALETAPLTYAIGSTPVALSTAITVADEDGIAADGSTPNADDIGPNSAIITLKGPVIAGESLQYSNTATPKITGTFANGVLTLKGTDIVENFQKALRAVTYSNTNPASLASSPRTVSFQLTRLIGIGAPKPVPTPTTGNILSRTIMLSVTQPTLSGIETAPLSYSEGNVTAVTQTLVVAAPGNLMSAVVRISAGYQNGRDVLRFTNTGTITGAFDSSQGTMTLSGIDTPANYQAALRTVQFLNANPAGGAATRTVSITVTDSSKTSVPVTRTISVAETDDRPVVVTGETSDLSMSASGPANQFKFVFPNLLITDEDSSELQGARVQITENYQQGQDFIGFSNASTPKIAGRFDGPSGTLILSGQDTLTNYRTALRTVTYKNTAASPNTAPRTVSVTVSTTVAPDPTGDSMPVTRNVAFA